MANTVTALVNLALRRLGDERINSIDDSTPRAVLAAELWPHVRDMVLADVEPSVAVARVQLSALSETNLTKYDYVYQLPVDPKCLRVQCLLDSTDDYREVLPEEQPYMIESAKLYTDQTPCYIKYIQRVEAVTNYPPHLVETMALYLAGQMAFQLTQSAEIEAKMLSLYQEAKMRAQAIDRNQSWEGYKTPDSWDQVRRGTSARVQSWWE